MPRVDEHTSGMYSEEDPFGFFSKQNQSEQLEKAKDENEEGITAIKIFLRQKNLKNEISGQLSKRKRMDSMYEIITDSFYNHKFTLEERLMAVDLLKEILKELK